MMKKQLLVLILSSLAAVNVHASFKQTINLCIEIGDNNTNTTVGAHFNSSDIMDKGETTPGGVCRFQKICISHEYSYGPKNIALKIEADEGRGSHALLVPSSSCFYLTHEKDEATVLTSNYLKTSSANETWNIKVTQGLPQANFNAVFDIVCEHTYL